MKQVVQNPMNPEKWKVKHKVGIKPIKVKAVPKDLLPKPEPLTYKTF